MEKLYEIEPHRYEDFVWAIHDNYNNPKLGTIPIETWFEALEPLRNAQFSDADLFSAMKRAEMRVIDTALWDLIGKGLVEALVGEDNEIYYRLKEKKT